jgi:hypothetical protein
VGKKKQGINLGRDIPLELEEMSKGGKYSKMDKGAKDKLAGSPGENGGG